jgi:hypothetical protein
MYQRRREIENMIERGNKVSEWHGSNEEAK